MLLDKIVQNKKKQIEQAKAKRSIKRLRKALRQRPAPIRSLTEALQAKNGTLNLICEMKKKSPSEGILKTRFVPQHILRQFEQGGAAAVSILTDETYFSGCVETLQHLRPLSSIPLLRKDFIVDEYQLYESRAMGADAVLLIVAILSENTLHQLSNCATELGLETLVEIHNEQELETALKANAQLIGVNNRNLDTLETNAQHAISLIQKIPSHITKVVASGIRNAEDLRPYQTLGVNGYLVGTTLMQAANISQTIKNLKGSFTHD